MNQFAGPVLRNPKSHAWWAISLGVLSLTGIAGAQTAAPIRWSTVGNSITEFSGYPNKLQALLGPAYKVENEGVSATTLLRKGNYAYWTTDKFKQTFTNKPDIISIKLGTNDSKPVNWPSHKGEFLGDARALVDTFNTISTKPRILMCAPVPVFMHNGSWSVDGINDPVVKDEIIPLLKQAATEKKLNFIDLHTFLEGRADYFTNDGVHPDNNKPGADSIAAMMFRSYKSAVTRIACIGNSITDNNHDANAYPIKLNQLMGRDYYVYNAGHSGRTLLRKGDTPYEQSNYFSEVFKFQPNVITIKLGTNDSKPWNWDSHKDEFIPDLNWLIDTLNTIPTKPRIFLCTPIPAWKQSDGTEAYSIRGDVIKNEIIPKIQQVAKERNLTVLDLYTPYQPYRNLTPDGVHPDNRGQDTLAHILYRALKDAPVSLAEPRLSQGRSGISKHASGTPRVGQGIPSDSHSRWSWLQRLLGREVSRETSR